MPFYLLRPFAWVVLKIAFWYYGGIRFEGRENVPRKGGVLITPNHVSNADPPVIGFAVPRASYFMANLDLFKRPVLGVLIRWFRGFPVRTGTPDRQALRRGEELLKRGEALVIFPEGTHSLDGKLQRMQPGALLLAQRASVPIVPTIIVGSTNMIPYGEMKPRRIAHPIVVRFGKSVALAELTGGRKGGEGLRVGAARLGEFMLALQEGRPYPTAAQVPTPNRIPTGPLPDAGTATSRKDGG